MAQRPLQTSQEMETRLTTTTDPAGPLVLPGAHCFLPTPPLSLTEPQTPVLAQPLRAWVQCHLGEWCFVLHTHTHTQPRRTAPGRPLDAHAWVFACPCPGYSMEPGTTSSRGQPFSGSFNRPYHSLVLSDKTVSLSQLDRSL